ncbi:S-layer homology domain-containing protein [Paenibacillus silviterrae]|uniref:S-layer homology domain-containing protein n=1 Tax=Paenibacillus silviterrae TaxID=3242194 RepID=UPI00254373E3|nr:S-layer homology domain-containing protein [Paenibacillus chinjuensis]
MSFIIWFAAWVSPAHAGFKDVDSAPEYSWAKPSVDEMQRRGILTGFPDGTFRPGEPVTKAEFTVMVYRLFPLLRSPEPAAISGVPENHWASREFAELYSTIWPIYAADEQNFYNESYTYIPEKQLSRWEVLMTLDALFSVMRGPSIADLTTSDTLKQLERIKDVSWNRFTSYEEVEKTTQNLSLMKPKLALIQEGTGFEWAGDLDYVKAEALYRYMKLGVITPDAQGFFYPDRLVTRAEAATILNRMVAAAGEDYAYVKQEQPLSGAYLSPGGGTGVGANLFYTEPDQTIILREAPSWYREPGKVLTKVAIQVESEQIMDVFVTMNGQTTKYTYEQLLNGTDKIALDVTGVKSFHVQGKARYPEKLQETGNNEAMIYVMDPEMEK